MSTSPPDDADLWYRTNRAHWDEMARLHPTTRFYDVPGFLAGHSSLKSIEREELPITPGQTLLHLQCHFGMDTLSWARLGARVTGVDFSPEAVRAARELAEKVGIEAEFICSNIYDLPTRPERQYDIVFTSYGALCWLPDLQRWAEIAAAHVRPGGTLYIVEVHPLAMTFDDGPGVTTPRFHYDYFGGEPILWQGEGSYADKDARVENSATYTWNHSLGEIVSALCAVGLHIEHLHEFPMSVCASPPFLARREGERDDGWWHLPDGVSPIPLLFSLRAHKPLTSPAEAHGRE